MAKPIDRFMLARACNCMRDMLAHWGDWLLFPDSHEKITRRRLRARFAAIERWCQKLQQELK